MSTSEPPEVPDESGAVPVGPEPGPTGAAGSGGSGGWGEQPPTEPLAIAALVWAIVSIVIPIVGTVIAFVLAARAADLIRRGRGDRSGSRYVTAARIVAGAVLAFWAFGLVMFFALRGGNGTSKNEVAVPTQPPLSTTLVPTTITAPRTTTTKPAATTTTKSSTTSAPKPTISVVPPPPTPAPTTVVFPTVAPSTVAPSTVAPTTGTPTTAPPTTHPTTTTNPNAAKAAALQRKLLTRRELGPSNRGIPNDQRFVVSYTPGTTLRITWAIDDGTGPTPAGTPSCTGPLTTPPPTSTSTTTTSTSTTSTTTTITTTTITTAPISTTLPPTRTTTEEARYEAHQIVLTVRNQLTPLRLNITGLQLVGTYPIDAHGESDVVQVLYSKATVRSGFANYTKAFTVPPAELVQCLNPAFK